MRVWDESKLIWPVFLALMILFYQSIHAPRSWQAIARDLPTGDLLLEARERNKGNNSHSRTIDHTVEEIKVEVKEPDTTQQLASNSTPAADPWGSASKDPWGSQEAKAEDPWGNETEESDPWGSSESSSDPWGTEPKESSDPVQVASIDNRDLETLNKETAKQFISIQSIEDALKPSSANISLRRREEKTTKIERNIVRLQDPTLLVTSTLLPVKDSVDGNHRVDLIDNTSSTLAINFQKIGGDQTKSQAVTTSSVSERSLWETPEKLIAELDNLQDYAVTVPWVEQVRGQITILSQTNESSSDVINRITRLKELVVAGAELGNKVPNPAVAKEIRIVNYSLLRWLDIQELAHLLIQENNDGFDVQLADRGTILKSIEDFSTDPERSIEDIESWSQFLFLVPLKNLMSIESPSLDQKAQQQELAKLVLERLQWDGLTGNQKELIETTALNSLTYELRNFTRPTVNLIELKDAIASLGKENSQDASIKLAAICQQLRLSSNETTKNLSRKIDSHYRNHNIRFSVNETLLKRLIPDVPEKKGYVSDYVLGIPVRGYQTTESQLGLKLIPSDHAAIIALNLKGDVVSETVAESGPVAMLSDTNARFEVSLPMQFSHQGLVSLDPQVNHVSSNSRLRRMETSLDWFPLVGSIVQNYAKNKRESQKGQIARETNYKLSKRVITELKDKTHEGLGKLDEKFQSRVATPMVNLGFNDIVTEGKTTEEQLTLRFRVASEMQLASHTPRPRASEHAIMSFQIHESALNNVIDQLQLNGREFTVPELIDYLSHMFNLPEEKKPVAERKDIIIRFAQEDPIRITLDEGDAKIELSFDKISGEKRSVENVKVSTTLVQFRDSGAVGLIREDAIGVVMPDASFGNRIFVRGVFSKIFSKKEPIWLVKKSLLEKENMSGLTVNQFEIQDGWIGLSISEAQRLLEAKAKDFSAIR